MTFQSLGLIEALLKAVRLQGYKTPSTIQQKAIPPILEGLDVLASAQTGTGKTAGFTLPRSWSMIFAPPTNPPTLILKRNKTRSAHRNTWERFRIVVSIAI